MSYAANPRYVVTLTSEGNNPIPTMIRLRKFLKLALRAFGLRCVAVVQEGSEPTGGQGHADGAGGTNGT
jgi:hypothetical protein